MPEWEFTMSANAATLLQFAQIFMQKTDTSIAGRAAFGTWAGVEQSRQRLKMVDLETIVERGGPGDESCANVAVTAR